MIPSRLRSFFKRHRVATLVGAVLLVGLVLNGALFVATMSRADEAKDPVAYSFADQWTLFDLQRHLDAGDVVSLTLANVRVTTPVENYTGGSTDEPQIEEVLVARTREGQDIRIDLDVEAADAAAALRSLGYSRLLTTEARDRLPEAVSKDMDLGSWIMIGIMIAVVIAVGTFVWKQRKSGSFGNKMVDPDNRPTGETAGERVTFADVAGCEEAKFELVEVVEFLKTPEKFTNLGARIPRGVMLEGPPGTGKTLLAKAVANEAGVPFFSASGSEFVEMYVGVGARRIRKLFADARKAGRAVVFIDEIDAIGKKRGGPNSHDERDQTLNQLLVELDGFTSSTNVVVIAATNRSDILDPALMRSGRFSRKVDVRAPDKEGRKAILAVHAKGKPMAADVDLSAMARHTGRLTGAQLADLLNEAAIFAARRGAVEISPDDLRDGMLKVQLGTGRQRSMEDRERAIIAVHEIGHAVCGRVHGSKMTPEEISLFAHGDALGVTVYSQEDNDLPSETDLRAQLIALMGGRAAEDLFFHERTPGAANDFEKATEMATAMVHRWGMGRDPESADAGISGRGILGFMVADRDGKLPAGLNEPATRAISTILDEAYTTARQTILANLQVFLKEATYIFQNERMSGDTFLAIFNGELPVVVDDPEVSTWLPVSARPRAWGELTEAAAAAAPMSVPVPLEVPMTSPAPQPRHVDVTPAPAPQPERRRRRRLRRPRPGLLNRARELIERGLGGGQSPA